MNRIYLTSVKMAFMSIFFILIQGCGGSFQKTPLDRLIQQLDNKPSYSIILYDMDVEGAVFKTYKHKYKIVTIRNEEPDETVTRWYEVSENFFRRHQNNLGMEIATKNDEGKLSKTPSPPGYGNYVGNEKYGHWVQRDGSSFWEFYGKWAMLSSIFNLAGTPVMYRNYNEYDRNYRGYRPYYGTRDRQGRYKYGTYSRQAQRTNPNFFERQRRRTNWQQSTSRRSYSGSQRSGSSRSRYSGSRSRSFGK